MKTMDIEYTVSVMKNTPHVHFQVCTHTQLKLLTLLSLNFNFYKRKQFPMQITTSMSTLKLYLILVFF